MTTNSSIIELDASEIVLSADIGTFSFTLTVKSKDFPGTVSSVTFPFNVDILCILNSIAFTTLIPDSTYVINSGAVATSAFVLS